MTNFILKVYSILQLIVTDLILAHCRKFCAGYWEGASKSQALGSVHLLLVPNLESFACGGLTRNGFGDFLRDFFCKVDLAMLFMHAEMYGLFFDKKNGQKYRS